MLSVNLLLLQREQQVPETEVGRILRSGPGRSKLCRATRDDLVACKAEVGWRLSHADGIAPHLHAGFVAGVMTHHEVLHGGVTGVGHAAMLLQHHAQAVHICLGILGQRSPKELRRDVAWRAPAFMTSASVLASLTQLHTCQIAEHES